MENKITMRQLQALIVVETFAVSAVFLPRGLANITQQNSWIWILAGGVIMSVLAAMASYIDGTVLYKNAAGRILCVLICGKIMLCTGLVLRMFVSTVNSLLLEKTPLWLTAGMMTILCLYTSMKGIKVRARAAEIIFFVITLILIFVYLLTAYNMKIENLLPINGKGGLKATWQVMLSIFGLEYLLFIRPYVNEGRPVSKRTFSAGVVCALLVGIIVLLTTAVFGAENMRIKNWAALQVANTIDFPIMLVERQDIVITAFWTASAFAFLNAGFFYTGTILSQSGVQKERDSFIFVVSAIIIWVVSLYPDSAEKCMEMLLRVRILNFVVAAVVLLWFIVKRGRATSEE